MNRLRKQSFYERLDVLPSASPFEICQAYRDTLLIYGDESLANYSFFPEEERKEILALLEEAFSALTNEQTRNEYDEYLIGRGKLRKEECYGKAVRKPVPIFARLQSRGASPYSAEEKGAGHSSPGRIPEREVLTGGDLQRIRTEMGLSLEHIAARTRIRVTLLQFIEEDEFDKLPSRIHLKSYLTRYVQCLHLDTASVVERYLKRITD